MVADIFMTGGAGFLGRAILERYAKEWPDCRFTIYSRDEAKQARVRKDFPQHRYILGDVCDVDRLELAMAGHQVVIHTAAMKNVPQGETDVSEAVAVNVGGSRNVCRAAIRNGVERVIGISSDKACRPVNVYGMTKLLMERLFQEAAAMSGVHFNLVRYGNVVSSTGSVIPIFRQQVHEGCITLTNSEMTRFWLTSKQAVDLILDCFGQTESGVVLIPRLKSLSIGGVATAVGIVELGDEKERMLDRRIIGQRFGEKVHEELVSPIETIYCEPPTENGVMKMYPVTEGERPQHIDESYTSDKPDESLTTQGMVEILRGESGGYGSHS